MTGGGTATAGWQEGSGEMCDEYGFHRDDVTICRHSATQSGGAIARVGRVG